MTEPYKRANPLIWGAVLGLIAAAMPIIDQLSGSEPSSNQLLRNPISAAVVGFFWGWVAGNAKNWYGKRINRR